MSERAGALLDTVTDQVETTAVPLGFDEAFTLHHRAVFRTARAIVRDSALAEDVTQEVFLRLYKNMDSTPGEELLRAWLLRVTINVARNTLRGQSRSVAREEEFARRAETTGWFTVEAPEEQYERRVEIESARLALAKINEPMWTALLL